MLFKQLEDSNQVGSHPDDGQNPIANAKLGVNVSKPFDQVRLYREVEIPLLSVLAAMEMRGIRVDKEHLARLGQGMAGEIEKLQAQIYELAGGPFDIQSLPQLRVILFKKLGLPALKKTGITKEPSTDQETLEKLAALDHPGAAITRAILDLRKITKLKSTYVDTLPTMVHAKTGRVHASFHQTVAATGRLSSSDPNLQNIPVRDEMGLEIRRAFLPEQGWDLWTADYSQIELRLLAQLSEDQELREAYLQGQDIHTRVAASLHGVGPEEVTAPMRRVAKTVNFGVVYGISAHGLADRLGIPRAEAEKFIEAYFRKYPGVLAYQEKVLDEGRKLGFVQTILGRRRRVEGIRPKSSYWQRNQPEREAINMVVQVSAADLIKIAMIGLEKRLSSSGLKARLLLQIHDELVLEAPPEERSALAAILQEEMVAKPHQWLNLEIPLAIDAGYGPNWVDTEEWV
jgi:DNA polymerase-1